MTVPPAPSGRWRAPGRVVLLGEEHDATGLALVCAIPSCVEITATRADSPDEIRFSDEPRATVRTDARDTSVRADVRDKSGRTDAREEVGFSGGTPSAGGGAGRGGFRARVFGAFRGFGRRTQARVAGTADGPVPDRTAADGPAADGAAADGPMADGTATARPWTIPAVLVAHRLRERGAGGVVATVRTDLPPDAGLGAPAALAAATALALRDLYGLGLDATALVPFAAEPGRPDAAASLLGVAGRALLVDRRGGGAGSLPFDLASAGLTLFAVDTRSGADAARAAAATRPAECAAAAERLGVADLGEVRDLAGALESLRDPVLRRRVQHVVTERHRIEAAAGLLRAGAFAELGAVLNASQMSLRDQFETSWPQADATVDAALRAGARGARIAGGPGGAVVILTATARAQQIRDAITTAFTTRAWPTPTFHDATPSDAATRLL